MGVAVLLGLVLLLPLVLLLGAWNVSTGGLELYGAARRTARPTPVLGSPVAREPALHTIPNAVDWFLFS